MVRLLVVDDDPRIRHLLEVVLSGAGHEVVLAESARAALEFLRKETPDLYDLLGHLAYGWPLTSLRERAARAQDPRFGPLLQEYLRLQRLPLEGEGLLDDLAQALYA